MTKSVSRKTVSLLLAFVMVFGVLLMPNITEAREDDSQPAKISYLEKDSYIKANASGTDGKDYVTITTIPKKNDKGYKNVVRGNIFLTYPKDTQADLTAVSVTLTAQKEFGFTLNGKTVEAGDSDDFTLDLTKENIAILDVSSNPDFEEGSYVITGAKKGESIDVKTSISVKYPKQWLKGEYEEIPGFPVTHPDDNDDAERVREAVKGFDKLQEVTIPVAKGTSAMKVLETYGEMFNMNITGISQGYISEMGVGEYPQIGEFDINSYSGWMYTVDENDEGWYFPNVGASAKALTKNTKMVWHFTMAYGQDIGAPWGEPGGDPGMPSSISAHNLYRIQKKLTIGDIVSQWANSNRPVESIK